MLYINNNFIILKLKDLNFLHKFTNTSTKPKYRSEFYNVPALEKLQCKRFQLCSKQNLKKVYIHYNQLQNIISCVSIVSIVYHLKYVLLYLACLSCIFPIQVGILSRMNGTGKCKQHTEHLSSIRC